MLSLSFAGQSCLGEVIPHSSVAPVRPEYHYGNRVTVTCGLGRQAVMVSYAEICMPYMHGPHWVKHALCV